MAATKEAHAVSGGGGKVGGGEGSGKNAGGGGAGRKEGPQKPDEKAYRAKLAEATKAIDEIRHKLSEVASTINASSAGREEFSRKHNEIRGRMEALQEKIENLEKERMQVIGLIDSKQKEGKELRANVQNLKRSIGFSTEGDIDKKIMQIEARMMTSTISLKEEKQCVQQISQLKLNKPLIGKYANLESNVHHFEDTSIVPLRIRLDQIKEQLNVLRTSRREEGEKFRSLMDKKNAEMGGIRGYYDQRDALNKELVNLNANKRQIIEEHRKKMDDYYAHMKQVNAAREERMREEQKKKQSENERQQLLREWEKLEEAPVDGETLLLQQTLNYVIKLLDEKNNANSIQQKNNEKNDTTANKHANLLQNLPSDVGIAVLPKKDREEEYYIAPKNKKGGKKGGKGKEKAKPLKLDLGTIAIFEQCGVSPPQSTDELEECKNKLQEKFDERKKQQQQKLEENKEKREKLLEQLKAEGIDLAELESGATPAVSPPKTKFSTANGGGGGGATEAASPSEKNNNTQDNE